MRVVIVGPGGLGGIFAGLLAREGDCRVTVVGRSGANTDSIRNNGLRLMGRAEFTVQLDVVDDPSSIEACDVLIYTVKAQDTDAALAATKHIKARSFVSSLQNGAIKDDLLAGIFGREKVVGGLAIVAGERREPGVVNWTFDGGTRFGELDGRSSARVDEVVRLFQQAGVLVESSSAITSATWSKMVGWIPLGLLATLSCQSNAGVLSNRLLATEFVHMVRELETLAAARDVPLMDVGPYHVKAWCEGTAEAAIELVMNSPLASSQKTHSALQDVKKGNRTEFRACVEPMIGEAESKSIPLNRIQTLYATLMGLEEMLQQG